MAESPKRIRNVALVGHRGSGKTSTFEAILYQAGAINRLGSVADGSTVSDSAADEKAREMSISSALASFTWEDRKVNLIDTPGEPSFVADALSALRVCEGAVFVVNELMERYLEGEEISHVETVQALKSGVTEGKIFPVTCGVATKNLGTNRLLDALIEDLPSPAKKGAVQAGDTELEPTEDGDLVALV